MKLIFAAALIAALPIAYEARAGWGAIAYNPNTGSSSESHQYPALPDALNAAMTACGTGCLIVTWEHDNCIAFAVSPDGVWGSSSNAPSQAAATDGALKACNRADCTVKQAACE